MIPLSTLIVVFKIGMALYYWMGRTILSYRMALEMEKEEWKPFLNAFDKSDRKWF